MQKIKRNIAIMLALFTILGVSSAVFAESNSGGSKSEKKIEKIEEQAKKKIQRIEDELVRRGNNQPIILEVGPKGKALIRGKIESVSTSTASSTGSITVKSWGGSWKINVYSDTEVIPKGSFPENFKVGDYVGARGQIDLDKSLTIDATVLRNWSRGEVWTQKVEDKKIELINKVERNSNVPAGFVATISADKARTIALGAHTGTIAKLELSLEEGKVVWNVRFTDNVRVEVDATTGSVVRIKQ